MQEQTSWSSTVFTGEAQTPTYIEVLLFLFTHCRWMRDEHRHSPARMRTPRTELQTPHRCLVAAKIPRLSTVPLDQRSRQILLMCAVSILVGLHAIVAGSSAGTVFTRTS